VRIGVGSGAVALVVGRGDGVAAGSLGVAVGPSDGVAVRSDVGRPGVDVDPTPVGVGSLCGVADALGIDVEVAAGAVEVGAPVGTGVTMLTRSPPGATAFGESVAQYEAPSN
jgi:hypothetical protein